MAPEIEISHTEAESIEQMAGRGEAKLIEETMGPMGPVRRYEIDGQELKLHQALHFDDQVDDHLTASSELITNLVNKGVISLVNIDDSRWTMND